MLSPSRWTCSFKKCAAQPSRGASRIGQQSHILDSRARTAREHTSGHISLPSSETINLCNVCKHSVTTHLCQRKLKKATISYRGSGGFASREGGHRMEERNVSCDKRLPQRATFLDGEGRCCAVRHQGESVLLTPFASIEQITVQPCIP